MKFMEIILTSLDSLLRHKTRSFLTMLGIIIGVGSVIAVVAIGQGAQHQVQQQISSLGSNVIIIFPGSHRHGGVRGGAGSFNRLKEADARAIRESCPSVAAVTPVARTGGQVVYGNMNWSTTAYGVYPDYLLIKDWRVERGTFFSEQQSRAVAKVCVIGKTVADNLFGDEDPLDKIIRFRKIPFRVIGVLEEKGQNMFGQDQDDIIMAPFSTVQRLLVGSPYVGLIYASAVSEGEVEAATSQIEELLRSRLRVSDESADNPFTIRTQTEIASAAQETSSVFTSLLYSVAAVSLIVGGIGIMNIMLVSVTERTREIGIRMAVGARRWDIMLQFLTEAIVLSAIGGILGILAGVVGSRIVTQIEGWPTMISTESIFLAIVVSGVVGVFFGFYPARKASMLSPIEALRYE